MAGPYSHHTRVRPVDHVVNTGFDLASHLAFDTSVDRLTDLAYDPVGFVN